MTDDIDNHRPTVAEGTQLTDRRLLEFLVCPVTRGPLTLDATRQELVSARARLAFPIRNGVPLMTVESARTLEDPA